MAISKSEKIQSEIDKLKVKITEQQTRLKELEQSKREAENSEIVDVVRGMLELTSKKENTTPPKAESALVQIPNSCIGNSAFTI